MSSIRQKSSNIVYKFWKKNVLNYFDELNRLQWLSQEEIFNLQQKQLYDLLEYANTFVPYYRKLFSDIDFEPADFKANPDCFQQIPPLTKSLIRENYDRLVTSEQTRRKNLVRVKTGGTTGEPLWFFKDKSYSDYNTAHDYFLMSWSGWQIGQPQFWLWGHVPDSRPSAMTTSFDRLKNWLLHRYGSNAFILSQDSMDQFATLLEKHPGGLLWSYVSTMYKFAQFLQERGHRIKLKAVYTAAEPLFEPQRQFIKQVLKCPVFNNYSSIDIGDIAAECEQHNGLHIMTRNCYVEVSRENQTVMDGEEGSLVLTNLTNYGMPMIRYDIEDWGRKSTHQCNCGRGFPLLEVVEGRTIDLFKTEDGRIVYGAFAKDLIPLLESVTQFQIIQKSLQLVIFRMVEKRPTDPKKLKYIEQVTKNVLGEKVEVRFETVDALPSSRVGKHRYLVSEVY